MTLHLLLPRSADPPALPYSTCQPDKIPLFLRGDSSATLYGLPCRLRCLWYHSLGPRVRRCDPCTLITVRHMYVFYHIGVRRMLNLVQD